MQTLDRGEANGAGRRPRPEWWLIVKDGNGSLEPLTIDGDGGENVETLPVFSFEEEAEMFLLLAGLRGSWRSRPSGCGEVVSILHGPCARVRNVALDPLPEPISEGTIGLLSLERDRFIDRLLGRSPRKRIPWCR